jgi:flagellar hook-length control protein FliK
MNRNAAHSAASEAEPLQHASRFSEVQPATVIQHGSAVAQTANLTNSPLGLHGPMSLAGKPGGVSSTLAAPASSEPFAAIDAGFDQARPTWIHAGVNHAEVGYQDAVLGWVGVRAEVGGGGIHAALVPSSAEAAQTLSGHMTELNAYLTDHHAGVERLTVAPPQQSNLSGSEQDSSRNMQQGTGQNSGQGSNADRPWMNQAEPPPISLAAGVEAQTSDPMLNLNPHALRTEGVHISVLA